MKDWFKTDYIRHARCTTTARTAQACNTAAAVAMLCVVLSFAKQCVSNLLCLCSVPF